MKIATLSFDDGHELDAAVARRLRAAGIRATFYIIACRIPTLDLAWYEGHEIGSHSLSHPRRAWTCTRGELERQAIESRRLLREWSGQEVAAFAYPRGQVTRDWIASAVKAQYHSARTFAVDPGNAWAIPDAYLVPVTCRLGRVPLDALLDLTKRGNPVHFAGHGYHYNSESRLEQLCALTDLVQIYGYEIMDNTEYIRRCLDGR